jgi:two-component system CheB/CheR fusion protein
MEAFTEVLANMPADSDMALVLVQHLDPNHQSVLTELLGRSTSLPVAEIQDGMRPEPNHVYVIPPNSSLTIENSTLHLGERAYGHTMPIDAFFRSLADDQGSKAIGVILSGTASDGTLGLKAIKAEGGITFCQDPATAKYDGMPRSAIVAGCVDIILPPKGLAAELVRLCKHPYVAEPLRQEQPDQPEPNLSEILTVLRNTTGVDFALYKNATIRRRIMRRMALNKIGSPEKYLAILRENRAEVQALFQDILINVTGFFREPSSFEFLKNRVFPTLFRDRAPDEQVRVWVAGCSTGEEAYSLGISMLEYMRENGIETNIQIFGTDLSEAALEKARAGIYPENISAEVSPDRLRRYFTKTNGNYQIARSVRDLCIFARQNLTKDPPFSRLDLILCRNVMIYLGPLLQQKLLRVFHYALRPNGFLALGTSETIGAATEMFQPLDRKQKIYARKDVPPVPVPLSLGPYDEPSTQVQDRKPNLAQQSLDLERRVDHLLASRYAPAGVVVDADLKALYFRGRTSPYLEHVAGEANLNLGKMMRGGLGAEVRKLVQRARAKDATVRSEPLQVSENGETSHVRVSVTPIRHSTGAEASSFMVLFEDVATHKGGKGEPKPPAATTRRFKDLEQELSSTKLYLQSVIEEQEATTEELKSANEEIQSSNEELQSTNEELLTAKEELQSTNEELTTVNEEMQGRNTELTQINNDLSNLLSSVNIPIIMVGNDLRLRRFTPHAEKFFNLLPTDVGRPLADFKPNIVVPDLEKLFLDAIDRLSISEREVHDHEGRHYSMWIRPYRTSDNKIDGAVMTLFDITERKNLAEMRFRRFFEASRDASIIADSVSGQILDINPAAITLLNTSRQDVIGRRLRDLRALSPEDFEELAAGLAANGSWRRFVTLFAQDGSRTEVDILANIYDEGDRKVLQTNIRDVNRRRIPSEMELNVDELARAALSRNAGGRSAAELAREFNGFLASIVESIDSVEKRLGSTHEVSVLLQGIKEAGDRAAAVGRLLLALTGISETEKLDLNSVVSDVAPLMKFTFPVNLKLELRPGKEPVQVTADRFPAQQILLELAGGARERMPRGGTVTLESFNSEVTDEFSREHPAIPPGHYGVLRVTDTPSTAMQDGRFSSAALLSQSASSGWLEGLQAAIRLAGGFLWCYSELGKGSTYSVYFPRMAE